MSFNRANWQADVLECLAQIARAEQPWRALRVHGQSITQTEEGWELSAYNGEPFLFLAPDFDTAMRNLNHSPQQKREWASFLLAASDLVDIPDEALLNQIWELAFGIKPAFQ